MPPKKRQIKEKNDKFIAISTDNNENSIEETKSNEKPAKKIIKKQGTLSTILPTKAQNNIQLGDGKFDKTQIKICSWNINGIRAVDKKKDFTNYIKNVNPDILCMGELKCDEESFMKEGLSSFFDQFKEYNYYCNFCKPPNKGYAGVAIMSKFKPISIFYDMGIEKHDQEGRIITLEYDNFYVVSIYVPNSGEGLKRLKYRCEEWEKDYLNFINNLKSKKHVIIGGDLNVSHHEIDVSHPKQRLKIAGFTVEEREKFGVFLKNGFKDTFRELYPKEVKYSFYSYRSNARAKNAGWRLDYFIVNDDLFNKKGAIVDSHINNDIFGSDHCPIELTLNLKAI